MIYERLLLTLLLNCYSGYKCWKGAELLNGNKVRSYSEYKKKSSGLVGSFPEFLFDLASNLEDKWLPGAPIRVEKYVRRIWLRMDCFPDHYNTLLGSTRL